MALGKEPPQNHHYPPHSPPSTSIYIHTLLLFLFRKGQAPQDYQPNMNMAYLVAIRLGISPLIKAGQGNPI